MTAKAFEIRDRGTFIPMVAIKLDPANEAEAYLLRRAGFDTLPSHFVVFGNIEGGHFYYDPMDQPNKTRMLAQEYIAGHFDSLEAGQVIDVEFITGQTLEPKQSERISP